MIPILPAVRDRMTKAFMECYRAVLACQDETGRKRCELFREVPDRRVSPHIIPPSVSTF
jgi:ATP-dependent helicase STH1/SNF2